MARDAYDELAAPPEVVAPPPPDPYSQLARPETAIPAVPRTPSGAVAYGKGATTDRELYQTEADRQVRRTIGDFTAGLLNYPVDAWTALYHSLTNPQSPGYGEEYEAQRRLTTQARERIRPEGWQRAADVASSTAGLTGQALVAAPLAAERTTAELSAPALQRLQSLWGRTFTSAPSATVPLTAAERETAFLYPQMGFRQQLGEAARYGGAFGAAEAIGSAPYGENPLETMRRMGQYTVGGTIAGPIIHTGVTGALAVPRIAGNAAESLRNAMGAGARARAEPWRDVDIEPALALTLGERGQRRAQQLSGTVLGGATRQDVAASARQLEERLQAALGPRTRSEAGEEAQQLLRRGVSQRLEPEAIERLTPEQMQDISGVGPGPGWRPAAARIPTTQEVQPEQLLERLALRRRELPPNSRLLAEGEIRPPAELLAKERNIFARQRRLAQQDQQLHRDVMAQRAVLEPFTEKLPNGGLLVRGSKIADNPAARAAWERYNRLTDIREGVRRQYQQLASEHAQLASSWDRMRETRIAAQQQRMRVSGGLQERAAAAAERLSSQRQRLAREQAIATRSAEVAERRGRASVGVRLPKAPGYSYATQAAVGERALAANAPNIQQPLISRRGEAPSALRTELGNLALEARGSLELRGYRPEQLFSLENEALHPGFVQWLRREIGPRATSVLERMSLQRQIGGEFTQGPAGTQRILEMLVRERGRRGVNQQVLARIERAVENDLARTAGTTAEGRFWLRQREEQRALRGNIIREIEEPLRDVMGTTNPAAALDMLQAATRRGGDINTLRAFLRVAEDKGNRSAAVAQLMTGLGEGGAIRFAQNWRALTPEAKQLIFQGPVRQLGARLERLAQVADSLERFAGRGGTVRATPSVGRMFRDVVVIASTLWTLPKTALGLGLTAKGLDYLLASRGFREWLLRAPRPGSTGNLSGWISQLSGLIAGSAKGGGLYSVIGPVGAGNLMQAGRPTAREAIRMAERLERQGMAVDSIRTVVHRFIAQNEPELGGIVRIEPGRWGVEISNFDATFGRPPPAAAGERMGKPTAYRNVMRDPEVEAAYPEMMRRAQAREVPEMRGAAAWQRGTFGEGSAEQVVFQRKAKPSQMLHEAEHLIQGEEGWPLGANPSMFEAGGALRHLRREGESAHQAYERMSGEWFARKAAQRQYMTGPERRIDYLEPPSDLLNIREMPRAATEPQAAIGGNISHAERLERVGRLLRAGKTQAEVAAELGTTQHAVEGFVKRHREALGIGPPKAQDRSRREAHDAVKVEEARRRFEAGETIDTIARDMRISPFRLGKMLRAEGVKTTSHIPEETRRRVIDLWRQGKMAKEIEQELGLRTGTAWGVIFRNRPQERIPYRKKSYRAAAEEARQQVPEAIPARPQRAREAQTPSDRAAMDLERKLLLAEERLRRAGRLPEEILTALRATFGKALDHVTAKDIASGKVWWRVGGHETGIAGWHLPLDTLPEGR